jgi:hypothetical protein
VFAALLEVALRALQRLDRRGQLAHLGRVVPHSEETNYKLPKSFRNYDPYQKYLY